MSISARADKVMGREITEQEASAFRWVILGLTTLSFLFTFMTRFSWPPLIPVMRPIFGFSAVEAGSFMSAFYFGYVLTQIPAGILADRLGPRFVLAGSLIIPGIFMFLMQYMHGYAVGFWMRFVIGLGAGANMSAATRAVTEWFPAKERTLAWGVLMSSPSLGLMLPNWIVPPINNAFGWQGVFQSFGIASIIIGIAVAALVRTSDTSVKSSGNPFGGLGVFFRSRNLILIALTSFSLMWVQLGIATWSNAYFVRLGYSLSTSGMIMVVYGAGAVLAPLFSPFWIRKFGSMQRLIFWALVALIPLVLLFGYLIGYVPSLTVLMTLGFVLGYVSYTINSPLNVLMTDVSGKAWAASAMGTSNVIFQMASIICPVAVGWSIDFTGNFNAAWYIIAGGAVAGLILISLLRVKEIET
jgi:MFS transporter, ACS family, hexuronate transporter